MDNKTKVKNTLALLKQYKKEHPENLFPDGKVWQVELWKQYLKDHTEPIDCTKGKMITIDIQDE